ncbi:carboxypeptidase-like protein [Breznakibacter xylanolyticus]|uniref:Carboxypeptidase-like protein n=1 Tax=Breznakibacter xylanolyticus TaxID=990 RepID=A0A2W7NCM9_9BACT|nr:TonB-dependent receptor [Breznakibacter xylanolyticus]PZX18131.1 carboxypeptidase-like protein [Breznakibacter xylanolyticus]
MGYIKTDNTYPTHCMKPYVLLALLLFMAANTFAQQGQLTGQVIDSQTRQPLPGANIIATNERDSLDKRFTTTDTEGQFVLKGVRDASYRLAVSFLGYQKASQSVRATGRQQQLPPIAMEAQSEKLGDVTVTGTTPAATLRGDTTEYNANAYKMNPDANVEDLVKKMPGVTVENGTVKAQGEDVKKVLVDGKPFFGDDPSVALKNLPAEIIERVQIFDQQSEQSQLTGFNDGQTSKTMNIVTRPDRRNGRFGNMMAGYGTDDRYIGAANLNQFNGNQRLSAVLMSNNINRQNFGTQDFLGAMGGTSNFGSRGGRGGGGGGSQSGITTIHSMGLNYSNEFENKLKLSGSYFYNITNTENAQTSSTEFILNPDSSRIEENQNSSEVDNHNHRINVRAEWDIDSMNTLIIVPSLNFQDNTSLSGNAETQGFRIGGIDELRNRSTYRSDAETSGYNLNNRITYRHKFTKKGRTLSADVNTSLSRREPLSSSLSDITYLTTGLTRLTDRRTITTNDGLTLTTNLAYSEPLGEKSMLQLNLGNSTTHNEAFRQTNDLDDPTHQYLQIDSLSNKYKNRFITNKAGLTYRFKTKKVNLSAGVELQNANLSGDQTYPQAAQTDKQFTNLLPNAYANIRLTDMQRITINYNTSTAPPSITQLQNVSEYSSNLTRVTKGNPDLEPQYRHNITSRLMHVNKETRSNFFVLFGGSILQNSIGNATIYLDTIQIVTPVNKGTGYTLRSMANYGRPNNAIKCNINLSGGYNYGRTPGFVNGNANTATTNAFSLGGVVSSNISDKIDFTLSSNATYNVVHNTVSSQTNNEYYSQTSSFRFNWMFWKNFTLQNDVANTLYRGLSSSFNQKITVVNLGIGKKMFKNNAGELRVTAYDLFNNNTSISRTITGNQITDQQSTTLNRYVMATFTYTLRNFKRGEMPENPGRDGGRFRPEGMPPGGRGGMGPMGPPPGM